MASSIVMTGGEAEALPGALQPSLAGATKFVSGIILVVNGGRGVFSGA
jgi:hypothetical protein